MPIVDGGGMDVEMKYVDVILDNKTEEIDNLFTYGCDKVFPVRGQRVYVPFGKQNKLKEAIVINEYEAEEGRFKNLKYVDSLDEDVILSDEMIATALFMKRRCFCKNRDGIKSFMPVGKPPKKKRKVPSDSILPEACQVENLTEAQNVALKQVQPYIENGEHGIFLLYGVTGSGKTEVYMQVIESCIKAGKTAVMLVPEISLTKQVIERFLCRFGQGITAILHSKLTSGQRYDEWMRIRKGEAKIVIGARSAIFAPLENIGAIIMDEEHESSYKSDMTPKYDTVDIAVKRAIENKGVLILGSATPSIVSTYRAEKGIYKKIIMGERYNKVALPLVCTVDMRKELLSGNKSIISSKLYTEMKNCLGKKSQVILFLNRRGYAPFISCRKCGYVLKCPECGISMTYHKHENKAVCHYCGRSLPKPTECPECQSGYIKHFGVGTEMLEEVISEMFPDNTVARLDLDTISKKGSSETILDNFKKGKTDILIGTQLVAKGLDFKNVGLVGIISADISLNIPDFRSAERTFQLITQAAGRAGRGDERGKVIIQSYTPDHYAVKMAELQDYDSFYKTEIKVRRALSYPPFGEIMQVIILARDEEDAEKSANEFYKGLSETLNKEKDNLLPPRKAHLAKVDGNFRYQIIIKCPEGKRNLYSRALSDTKEKLLADLKKRKAMLSFDINPYSLM